MITVRAYPGIMAGLTDLAAVHQEIRDWQVSTTPGLVFGDDSRPDLSDIEGAYLRTGGGFWVAESTTAGVVGFVALRRAGSRAGVVKRFAVLPQFQRMGVGTRLVHALVSHARNLGLDALTLSTGRVEKARGIYERAGFVVTGYNAEFDDDHMELQLHHLARA